MTVRDSGDFVIPLDVKALATGVKVKPTEVRLLVPCRRSRTSA